MSERLPDNNSAGEHEQKEQAFHDTVIFLLYALDYAHSNSRADFYCGFTHDDDPELFENHSMTYLAVNVLDGGDVLVTRQHSTGDDKLRNDEYGYNLFDRTLTLESTLENSNDSTDELGNSMDELDEKAMDLEDAISLSLEKMEQSLRTLPEFDEFFESFDNENELLGEQRKRIFKSESTPEQTEELAKQERDIQAMLLDQFDIFSKQQPEFANLLETYRKALAYLKILENEMDEVQEKLKREKNVTEVVIDESNTIKDELTLLLNMAVKLSDGTGNPTKD